MSVIAAARSRRSLWAVAIMATLVVSTYVVYGASQAAFTATTDNPGNTWEAGSLGLTDDDAGAALFTATGLVPGATDKKCITVTYNGDVPAEIRMYATNGSGTLLPYLDMYFLAGAPNGALTCGGTWTGGESTTLAAFNTGTIGGFANGRYSRIVQPGDTVRYGISYTLNALTPDTLQDGTAATSFTWEARSL